jgi:hypothetical protein
MITNTLYVLYLFKKAYCPDSTRIAVLCNNLETDTLTIAGMFLSYLEKYYQTVEYFSILDDIERKLFEFTDTGVKLKKDITAKDVEELIFIGINSNEWGIIEL